MDVVVKCGAQLTGELTAPSSKSYGQRALAASFLVPELTIVNLGRSADELAALEIVKQSGASISKTATGELVIQNAFDFNSDIDIICHESGLCARLFTGLMLLNLGRTAIVGSGSLVKRPMNSVFPVLSQLGIAFQSQQNCLPIVFNGTRRALDLEIDGGLSSQFVSGLLYYLVGLRHEETLRLIIHNIKSRPYIDMTVDLLRQIGGVIEWTSEDLLVHPSDLKTKSELEVEGDWSSAAFWIVAAAIGGDIRIRGLNPSSLQADKLILDIVQEFGAIVNWNEEILRIQAEKQNPFTVDLSDAPDLAPILAVLAMFSNGQSKLKGVDRLIYKESNRLKGILNWLGLLNIPYILQNDTLHINGSLKNNTTVKTMNEIVFETDGDHRMTMAACILAHFLMRIRVKGREFILKSYPDFFKDFLKLGGSFNF